MENSQGPNFKHSTRKKNLQPEEYFEEESEPRNNPTFDDYRVFKKFVETTPIVGYLVRRLGLKLVKTKDTD